VEGLEPGRLRAPQNLAQVRVEIAIAETLDPHYAARARTAGFGFGCFALHLPQG